MCKCCEKIEFIKEIEKSTKLPNIKKELKATITSITKRKGVRGIVGRIDYKSYDLNYCPMCGRKLKEGG